jgi:hypothetical protein
VTSTLESIEFVATAKYYAENPSSRPGGFLMHGAEAICNSQAPSSMAQMFGLDARSLKALTPQQWFQNPCGPALFEDECDWKQGPSGAHSLSPDTTSKNDSESSRGDDNSDDGRQMSF